MEIGMTARMRRSWMTCLVLAAVCTSALVWRQSKAALTDTVDNAGNAWSSAQVGIGTDLQLPMFAEVNMAPSRPIARCVKITYTGDVRAAVRMYTTPGSFTGDGADYFDLTVEEGSGGGAGSCVGFVSSSAVTGSLADFVVAHTDFASGVGAFAPTGPASITYRLTVTVRDDANGQQPHSSSASFTWEAQNI
jgi:hypothetical protein